MDAPLDRRLAVLRYQYAVRSLAPTTDAAAQEALFDRFVHDAMVLLEAAYGPECAARVRDVHAVDDVHAVEDVHAVDPDPRPRHRHGPQPRGWRARAWCLRWFSGRRTDPPR